MGTGDPVAIYPDSGKLFEIAITADGQAFRGAAVPGAPGAFDDLVEVYRCVIFRIIGVFVGNLIFLLFNCINHFNGH